MSSLHDLVSDNVLNYFIFGDTNRLVYSWNREWPEFDQ